MRKHGIYEVRCKKGENLSIIKPIGIMELAETESVADEKLESYELSQGLLVEIHKCNITDTALLLTKKLPVLYAAIIYERPLRRILLFRIYVYFTVTDTIKSSKELINHPIKGNFHIELSMNDKKEVIDNLDFFPGKQEVINKIKEFINMDDMKIIINDIVADVNQKLTEEFREEFEYFKKPEKVISLKNYKIND